MFEVYFKNMAEYLAQNFISQSLGNQLSNVFIPDFSS